MNIFGSREFFWVVCWWQILFVHQYYGTPFLNYDISYSSEVIKIIFFYSNIKVLFFLESSDIPFIFISYI